MQEIITDIINEKLGSVPNFSFSRNGKIKLPVLKNKKRHIIKTYDTMLVSNQTLKGRINYVSR